MQRNKIASKYVKIVIVITSRLVGFRNRDFIALLRRMKSR